MTRPSARTCVSSMAGFALVLLLLPLSSAWQVQVSGDSKVRVDVYFESLCSDSIKFFNNQLIPTWAQLKDIMDLHLIPFGKARGTPLSNGDYSFDCQHGPDECFWNKVMSCVQNLQPIDKQVQVIHCMITKKYHTNLGAQCSSEAGVDWNPINSCSQTTMGSSLLFQNGVKTAALKPKVSFIPTIKINGYPFDAKNKKDMQSFKNQICQAYRGPSKNCL